VFRWEFSQRKQAWRAGIAAVAEAILVQVFLPMQTAMAGQFGGNASVVNGHSIDPQTSMPWPFALRENAPQNGLGIGCKTACHVYFAVPKNRLKMWPNAPKFDRILAKWL